MPPESWVRSCPGTLETKSMGSRILPLMANPVGFALRGTKRPDDASTTSIRIPGGSNRGHAPLSSRIPHAWPPVSTKIVAAAIHAPYARPVLFKSMSAPPTIRNRHHPALATVRTRLLHEVRSWQSPRQSRARRALLGWEEGSTPAEGRAESVPEAGGTGAGAVATPTTPPAGHAAGLTCEPAALTGGGRGAAGGHPATARR